ncbi:unnamed protein product [Rotaria sp. Silwood1]|nr:unnamed protein product [Rotaria sp. Silwood1]
MNPFSILDIQHSPLDEQRILIVQLEKSDSPEKPDQAYGGPPSLRSSSPTTSVSSSTSSCHCPCPCHVPPVEIVNACTICCAAFVSALAVCFCGPCKWCCETVCGRPCKGSEPPTGPISQRPSTPTGSISQRPSTPTSSISQHPSTPTGSISRRPSTPTGSISQRPSTPTSSISRRPSTPTGSIPPPSSTPIQPQIETPDTGVCFCGACVWCYKSKCGGLCNCSGTPPGPTPSPPSTSIQPQIENPDTGEINEHEQPNGTGTYIHHDIEGQIRQGRYVGEWKDDKKHGKGTHYYRNGDTYKGSWKGGERDGDGTYTYYKQPSAEYKGQWKNDKKHGKGVLKFTNGDKYDGDWKNNKMESAHATYAYADGSEYVGKYSAHF